jgi:hypothetical protein
MLWGYAASYLACSTQKSSLSTRLTPHPRLWLPPPPPAQAVKAFLKDMGLTADDVLKNPNLARDLVGYHTILGVAAGPKELFAKGNEVEVTMSTGAEGASRPGFGGWGMRGRGGFLGVAVTQGALRQGQQSCCQVAPPPFLSLFVHGQQGQGGEYLQDVLAPEPHVHACGSDPQTLGVVVCGGGGGGG